MERLNVIGFLGLEDVSLDVLQINILIGPQASGKSVIAKSLFFFKQMFPSMIGAVETDTDLRRYKNSRIETFKEYFPTKAWGTKKFKIRYELGDSWIELERRVGDSNKLSLTFSDSLNSAWRSLCLIHKKFTESQGELESRATWRKRHEQRERLQSELVKRIGLESGFEQIFVPAGRSFFSNLQKNIFGFLSENRSIDPFLKHFGSVYEFYKDIYSGTFMSRNTQRRKLAGNKERFEKILAGEYFQDSSEDFIKLQDSRVVNVANASSGQQEILPLGIAVCIAPYLSFEEKTGTTIYIEEPEAHLFPKAQRDFVKLLAQIVSETAEHNSLQLVVTTHSPYFITAFNNLVFAHSVGSSSSSQGKRVSEIVPKELWVDGSKVSAHLVKRGKISSVFGKDRMLNAAEIDDTSDLIAEDFDRLLEVMSETIS